MTENMIIMVKKMYMTTSMMITTKKNTIITMSDPTHISGLM
jgi:hypothetical protein